MNGKVLIILTMLVLLLVSLLPAERIPKTDCSGQPDDPCRGCDPLNLDQPSHICNCCSTGPADYEKATLLSIQAVPNQSVAVTNRGNGVTELKDPDDKDTLYFLCILLKNERWKVSVVGYPSFAPGPIHVQIVDQDLQRNNRGDNMLIISSCWSAPLKAVISNKPRLGLAHAPLSRIQPN